MKTEAFTHGLGESYKRKEDGRFIRGQGNYVDYEPLKVVVDPKKALLPDAPLLRPDKKDKQPTNQIYHWETGDKAGTEAAFVEAQANGVVIEQDMFIPRIHPAPIETCGCVADFHKATGKLTVWLTSQAPHAHRTLFAIVAGLPEHRIRIISPDVGGGFGNKVPIYPGYVCAVVASITTGKPVKWIEDRTENLSSTGFGRDYHIKAEIAADKGCHCCHRINKGQVHARCNAPGNARTRSYGCESTREISGQRR